MFKDNPLPQRKNMERVDDGKQNTRQKDKGKFSDQGIGRLIHKIT
jgi:hypothetical protein